VQIRSIRILGRTFKPPYIKSLTGESLTEEKTVKIYEEMLRLLKVVMERDFQPCGLEKPLKAIIYDLASKAAEENWTGFKIVVGGVLKAVEQARSLAERYNKDFCLYLDMAIKRGWIENWVLRFRGSMTQ